MMRFYFSMYVSGMLGRLPRLLCGGSAKETEEETSFSVVPSGFPVEVIPSSSNSFDTDRVSWCSAAASVAGASHVARGVGCDDWYELRGCDETLVIVVADGMGSAQFGGVGARVATKAATRYLLRSRFVGKSDKQLLSIIRTAVAKAQEAVESAARELSCNGRDLATTLVCVAATKQFVALSQVGDCSCVVLTAEGDARTLTSPMKGEYVNQTFALGDHEEVLLSKVFRGKTQGVAVFTDGLERLALYRDRPYMPFLEPIWRYVSTRSRMVAESGLKDLLTSERIQRATDDDCTLVVGILATDQEVEYGNI